MNNDTFVKNANPGEVSPGIARDQTEEGKVYVLNAANRDTGLKSATSFQPAAYAERPNLAERITYWAQVNARYLKTS